MRDGSPKFGTEFGHSSKTGKNLRWPTSLGDSGPGLEVRRLCPRVPESHRSEAQTYESKPERVTRPQEPGPKKIAVSLKAGPPDEARRQRRPLHVTLNSYFEAGIKSPLDEAVLKQSRCPRDGHGQRTTAFSRPGLLQPAGGLVERLANRNRGARRRTHSPKNASEGYCAQPMAARAQISSENHAGSGPNP